MPRSTVAQAIVAWLPNQYVERDGERQRFFEGVFGIFGHGIVAGMGEALEAAQDSVRYYQTRNEQAMVHTAAAFAKQSLPPAHLRLYASIGPGATNIVTGAANATVNRLPVLLLPGDRFATRRVQPGAPAAGATRRPATSRSTTPSGRCRATSTASSGRSMLIDALPAAMRVLTSPSETGAVTLAVPQDVQAEAWEWPTDLLAPRTWTIARPRPDAGLLAQAAERIAAARRPMLVAGGGAIYSGAEEALAAFATRFGIPVVETQAGKGALHWDHPFNLGAVGSAGGRAGNAIAREADLVIAVGTRLSDFPTMSWSSWQVPRCRLRVHQRGRDRCCQGGCRGAGR